MTEFSKDYASLIKEAREDGDNDRVRELTRQQQNEEYLSNEDLQRNAGRLAAEKHNNAVNRDGVPGKKV